MRILTFTFKSLSTLRQLPKLDKSRRLSVWLENETSMTLERQELLNGSKATLCMTTHQCTWSFWVCSGSHPLPVFEQHAPLHWRLCSKGMSSIVNLRSYICRLKLLRRLCCWTLFWFIWIGKPRKCSFSCRASARWWESWRFYWRLDSIFLFSASSWTTGAVWEKVYPMTSPFLYLPLITSNPYT